MSRLLPVRPASRPWPRVPGALSLACLLVLAACGGGGGGGSDPTPPPGGWVDANHYSTSPGASLSTPNEATATSHGQSAVAAGTVDWTATAGHLTATDDTGHPEASFFHVDYTVDGADPATRPVTFFFNGGPGSASAWLHLGSFAPRRIDTNVPDATFPRDMPYVDNTETLIDTTDLVFVDAVGTGYSEAIAPFTNASFWSVDVDAVVMRDFIERWRTTHHRESSPLYVYGESYGTVRGPLVVEHLEMAGIHVAGLVLQSSILDYNSNCGVTSNAFATVPCTGFVPSYAAVGAWLGRVQPAPSDLDAFLDQVTAFADTTYDPAVRSWLLHHSPAPSPSIVDTLAADTGLPAAQWQAHFNMDSETYRHAIVPGSVAGLYDGRIVAVAGSPLAANDEPSDTLISGPFTSRIGQVLADIGYTTPSTYVMLSDAIETWKFTHADRSLPDVVPDLATALTLDPSLRVLSLNGIHDLITPYHQTQLDLARLDASLAARIAFRRYPGGHMTYLDDDGRVGERADLGAFYAGTLATGLAQGAGSVEAAARSARLRVAAASSTRHAASVVTPSSTVATVSTVRPLAVQAPAAGRRDPGRPSAAALAGVRTAPGSQGDALQAEVTARLKAQFDRADTAHTGRVDAARAQAAGQGALARAAREAAARGRDGLTFEEWVSTLRAGGRS